MKKIVYLMEYPLDLPGGAQLSTEMIASALALHPEYGYESVVICPELLSRKKAGYPFKILTYPMTEKRFPNLVRRIKAFKKYMHDTPIMHLNKRRISDAKALLKDKNLQLMDIATAVGYKNLSTFTEAFKRCMGLLPSEYRKKYIQDKKN